MRVPVILRVYTNLLVPLSGCGRFWAGLVTLENNENSKGSFFELSGFHLDLEPASSASAPARPPRRPDDFLIRLGLRRLGSLHRRHLHDLVRDHESGCGHGTCDGPHSGSRSGLRSELSHQRDAVG